MNYDRLELRLSEIGLSRRGLAVKLGKPVPTVLAWFQRRSQLPEETIRQVENAVGLEDGELSTSLDRLPLSAWVDSYTMLSDPQRLQAWYARSVLAASMPGFDGLSEDEQQDKVLLFIKGVMDEHSALSAEASAETVKTIRDNAEEIPATVRRSLLHLLELKDGTQESICRLIDSLASLPECRRSDDKYLFARPSWKVNP